MRATFGPKVLAAVVLGVGLLLGTAEPATASDSGFMRSLIDVKDATFEHGVKAIYLIDTRAKKVPDFNTCLVHLIKQKMVSLEWNLSPEQPLTHGRLAWMLFKVLRIKGGLSLRLTMAFVGLTERYAYRECTHIEVIADTGQLERMNGETLLSTIRDTRTFQKKGQVG